MKHTIVTVGRQYGSGGREIGTLLAERLGITCYDDELLRHAAQESGLNEKLVKSFDEKPRSFLFSIAMNPYAFSMGHITATGSLEEQVYLAMHETICKLADRGSCVLIGRCADYALKDRSDTVNIFIYAPLEKRIERVARRNDITPEEARERIRRIDKQRASYYNYYSSKEWGAVESYDFCIDSSLLGVEGTVDVIERLLALQK